MRINAIFEDGVFKPTVPILLPERKEMVIYIDDKVKNEMELENAYREASRSRNDLDDWCTVDIEGLK